MHDCGARGVYLLQGRARTPCKKLLFPQEVEEVAGPATSRIERRLLKGELEGVTFLR